MHLLVIFTHIILQNELMRCQGSATSGARFVKPSIGRPECAAGRHENTRLHQSLSTALLWHYLFFTNTFFSGCTRRKKLPLAEPPPQDNSYSYLEDIVDLLTDNNIGEFVCVVLCVCTCAPLHVCLYQSYALQQTRTAFLLLSAPPTHLSKHTHSAIIYLPVPAACIYVYACVCIRSPHVCVLRCKRRGNFHSALWWMRLHQFCAPGQAFCVLPDYRGLDSFSKKAPTLANIAKHVILYDFQVLCLQYLKY